MIFKKLFSKKSPAPLDNTILHSDINKNAMFNGFNGQIVYSDADNSYYVYINGKLLNIDESVTYLPSIIDDNLKKEAKRLGRELKIKNIFGSELDSLDSVVDSDE